MLSVCKLQICCFIIIAIVQVVYYQGVYRRKKQERNQIFESIISIGSIEIFFDGISAFTVNNLELIPNWVNIVAHLFFLLMLDTEIFLLFIYIIKMTDAYPKKKNWFLKMCLYLPYAISVLAVVIHIDDLHYVKGKISNYSMGFPVYTCFLMIGIYLLLSIFTVLKRIKYISKNKRLETLMFFSVFFGFTTYQIFFPESLMTSAAVMLMILGIYLNEENPLYHEITDYNEEMVNGFATLVENRDGNTGGHIIRTSAYVEALARELRRKGIYSKVLTGDYVNNLRLAAPMHDVGKISIPDSILQKPGKLTDEEFSVMKSHASEGGKIVKKTFGNTANKDYTKIAYDVATYHHEKWNGTGYPNGLSKEEIPLSARIMAVADVFDAVSEKRCYKEAFPLEECFKIIEDGEGTDFDPEIAKTFVSMKDEIIAIRNNITHQVESSQIAEQENA